MENPDQLERLQDDPDRYVEPAVEEIVRWTTPVIQFARTATRDVVLHGQTIRAGDTVGIWYPSANRDERQFDEPYRFDVGRDPNYHVGVRSRAPLLPGRQPGAMGAPGDVPSSSPGGTCSAASASTARASG